MIAAGYNLVQGLELPLQVVASSTRMSSIISYAEQVLRVCKPGWSIASAHSGANRSIPEAPGRDVSIDRSLHLLHGKDPGTMDDCDLLHINA